MHTRHEGGAGMPEQPTIQIPLDLPDVRVLRTELTRDLELIIEIESTLTSTTLYAITILKLWFCKVRVAPNGP